jgi:hypothetical protein
MLWSNLRDGNPITRHTLNFEIPLPQSTATRLSFSDKARLYTLVLEMHEQGMSYREIGKALGATLDTATSDYKEVSAYKIIYGLSKNLRSST